MIDSGETDWKLITINVEDPLADKMHGMLAPPPHPYTTPKACTSLHCACRRSLCRCR